MDNLTGDSGLNLVYAIGALVLVASVLFSERLRLGQFLRLALAWVAIFAVAIVLFSYREEAGAVWARVKSELIGVSEPELVGSTVVLKQSADGHFWANVSVNGKEVPFMIDSGATVTAINQNTASRVGIEVSSSGFPMAISTANGTVMARRAIAEEIQVGSIVAKDLGVIVAPEFGDTNVIGMNFLTMLKSWRVEGGEMILEP